MLIKLIYAGLAVLLGLSPLAWSEETLLETKPPNAIRAELQSKSGSKVRGHVTFTEAKDGVKVESAIAVPDDVTQKSPPRIACGVIQR